MVFGLKIIGLLVLLIFISMTLGGIYEKYELSESYLWWITVIPLVVIAFYMCLLSDREKERRAIKRVQKRFKKRPEVDLEGFTQSFKKEDVEFACLMRKEVASFFKILEEKIAPDVNVWEDFELNYFEPILSWNLVLRVFSDIGEYLPQGEVFGFPVLPENISFTEWFQCLKSYKEEMSTEGRLRNLDSL